MDDFALDPRVDEIIREVEAAGGTVNDAYDRLVAEGFDRGAVQWVLKLYATITAHVGNA